MITMEERAALEKEIREQIQAERRAVKMEWRRHNKESVRRSNQKYRAKVRAAKEGATHGSE